MCFVKLWILWWSNTYSNFHCLTLIQKNKKESVTVSQPSTYRFLKMMVPQIIQVVDYQKNALNNHLQLQGILVISVCF
jgi:hypothetical protein